jgi:5-methylcytosine-specific restriction protein A
MPLRPFKPCGARGCQALTRDPSGRCPAHPKEAWTKRPEAPKRITGRRLQAMRAELFERAPRCAECERRGRLTLATERDHIVPVNEGGTDDPSNIQGLCGPCHETKSKAERQRAARRRA